MLEQTWQKQSVNGSVLSLEGCRRMCQDRGMMKYVFVRGSAEQHLLKMNVRLETQSPPRAGRVWGMGEGAWWCRVAAQAVGRVGEEQGSPAQSCVKAAGGELIRQGLKRWEGSWC